MRSGSGESKEIGRGMGGAGLGTAAGTLAIVALVALVPVSQAASATSRTTVPITDFQTTIATDTQVGGCGSDKLVKAPHFSYTTRLFKGSVSADAPYCKALGSDNVGYAAEGIALTSSNIPFTHNGNYVLRFTWNVSVDGTWSLTPWSICALNYANLASACFVEVEAVFSVVAEIIDDSNYSWGPYGDGVADSTYLVASAIDYVGNTSYGNYSSGSTGSGSFSGPLNGTTTFTLSGTSAIVRSNTYTVALYLDIYAYVAAYAVYAKAAGKASASASVNCATGGNQAFLRSITLT